MIEKLGFHQIITLEQRLHQKQLQKKYNPCIKATQFYMNAGH